MDSTRANRYANLSVPALAKIGQGLIELLLQFENGLENGREITIVLDERGNGDCGSFVSDPITLDDFVNQCLRDQQHIEPTVIHITCGSHFTCGFCNTDLENGCSTCPACGMENEADDTE